MSNIQLPVKVKISDDVLFQQVGGEGVLLDMGSEQYFGLDDISLRIWEILSENDSVENLFTVLINEYDVTEDVLKQDVANVLETLAADKLITFE